MNLVFYDPKPWHDYLSLMYFAPMMNFLHKTGHAVITTDSLEKTHGAIVITLADHLNAESVATLRNNGCKIVGFSVSDSSWISQSCRSGSVLQQIDLMFMLTGIQKINYGMEFVVTPDFGIKLEGRQFLPDEDWSVFNAMRLTGRLQSLPYVHWHTHKSVVGQPYSQRSQKVIIRGGNHMRRFILSLFLLRLGRLDMNSGFLTDTYFQEQTVPQFRFCEECRETWGQHKMYPEGNGRPPHRCTNPKFTEGKSIDLSDLGAWNNKCPESFFAVARAFEKRYGEIPPQIETLLNGKPLAQDDHLALLSRIVFTSDCKWLFSIYAAQRFWDGAMTGCVNLLPERTADQEYFPQMEPGVHYQTFVENFATLDRESQIEEGRYNEISKAARSLYDEWIAPTDYAINTKLLKHIFETIRVVVAP